MIALATDNLGKRYGRRWALRHCTLSVPAGRVVGLVGANGAGKTTLMHLAVGLLDATEGSISVLGDRPGTGVDQLARVGFLAQDAPVYPSEADEARPGEEAVPTGEVSGARCRINGDSGQGRVKHCGEELAMLLDELGVDAWEIELSDVDLWTRVLGKPADHSCELRPVGGGSQHVEWIASDEL